MQLRLKDGVVLDCEWIHRDQKYSAYLVDEFPPRDPPNVAIQNPADTAAVYFAPISLFDIVET